MIKKALVAVAALGWSLVSASDVSAQTVTPVNRENCRWSATTRFGLDTITLTVKGICQEPTPGYKLTLTPVALPHDDPTTLTLALGVVAPTGIEPQHTEPTPVEYVRAFVVPSEAVPSKVNIFESAETLNVTAASSAVR
jgi:hypothetical protein